MSNEEINRQRFAAYAHLRPSPSSAEHHGGEMNGYAMDGWMDGPEETRKACDVRTPRFAHLTWRHGSWGATSPWCNVDVVRFLIEKYPHALGHCAMRRHRYRWWEKDLHPRDLVLELPKTNPNRQHLVEVIGDFEDDIDVEDNRKVRHSRSIWKYGLGWTDRRQRTDLDADVVDSQ